MALRQNTAEGGSNGVVITTQSQTGGASGDSFNSISTVTSSVLSFSNSQKMHGALAYKFAHASGERMALSWSLWGGATQVTVRSYHYLPTLPTVNHLMITASNTSGQSYFSLYWNASNRILLQDRATALYNPTTTLTAGTWYRMELSFQLGNAGGDGHINFAYFAGDSTTALGTFSTTTADLGVSGETLSLVSFGRVNTGAAAYDSYLDSIASNTGTLALLGPYVPPSNQLPTASAGSAQFNLEPYTTVSLTGTDSDPDGTVVSRQWRQVSGSPSVTLINAASAAATYMAPGTIAGTTLTFGYKVTDNNGAESIESTVTNDILPVTERAVTGGAEVPVNTKSVIGGGLV